MSVASLREHTDAVIAALEAADLSVGDAEAPDAQPPYVVVYAIPGGRAFGSLAEPHEDAELVYQITCVGKTREQAEWLADKAMVLLDGLTVDGRSIAFVTLDSLPGVQRQTEPTPAVFLSTPRFRVYSTPT